MLSGKILASPTLTYSTLLQKMVCDFKSYFALKDLKNQDYGVGIAKFEKTNNQQWKFHKFYFQPAYEAGNIGFEDCTQVK